MAPISKIIGKKCQIEKREKFPFSPYPKKPSLPKLTVTSSLKIDPRKLIVI